MSQVIGKLAYTNTPIKRPTFLQQYLDFCDSQTTSNVLWFLLPLITLPAAIMPITILMLYTSSWLLPFIGISMLLFFTNILATIGGYSTRVTISIFALTIFINLLFSLLILVL